MPLDVALDAVSTVDVDLVLDVYVTAVGVVLVIDAVLEVYVALAVSSIVSSVVSAVFPRGLVCSSLADPATKLSLRAARSAGKLLMSTRRPSAARYSGHCVPSTGRPGALYIE